MPYQSEVELLAALKDSEFWKYILFFLDSRREALFVQDANTAEALWRQKGAIDEITRLKHMPALILEKHRLEAEQRREALARQMEPSEDFDG